MGIKFERVDYKYDKTSKAIKNINLNIEEKNEFICVLGQTGSGKTTLLQHMNALIKPTYGEIYIMGQRINKKSKRIKGINNIRKNIGFVFQLPEYQLFEENILKEVMFAPLNFGETEEEALKISIESLELVNINKDFYDKSPFLLSGGQQKKVTIASILSMRPKVLILDEPTRGLDPKGKKEIMNLFKKIHNETNVSIILITHDMDIVAEYSKRIIVMQDGSIVFDGNKEKLFKLDVSKYKLELPTATKIANEINKKLNMNLKNIFTEDDLIKCLKGNI